MMKKESSYFAQEPEAHQQSVQPLEEANVTKAIKNVRFEQSYWKEKIRSLPYNKLLAGLSDDLLVISITPK